MRFGWFRSKAQFEDSMSEELRDHMERQTAANVAAGMPADEARRRAHLQLGALEGVKEDCREERRGFWLENTWANSRYALRMMRRDPGFTLVVVLTLALGIGANSAVFSAVDAILLKPLPFPNGDQLMRLSQHGIKDTSRPPFVAPVRVEDWNRMNSTFQAITGYYTDDASETSGTLPEKITEAFVAPRFLQVWGIAPALGRDFTPEEERAGGPYVVLISDRLWRRKFNADPNAVGKKLRFAKESATIIGIMPASFLFPDRDVDIWSTVPVDTPLAQDRNNIWYTVIGRLKPGVTLAQARSNLATIQGQLGKQFPKPDADLTVDIQPLKETIVAGVRGSFWLLFGSVSLLLLIACSNIVSLLLARASQRHHEISVRFSLGASRTAIIGQLLAEVFLLALTGALCGLMIAGAASRIFRVLAGSLPRVEEIHLDPRIVLYTLACAAVVTLLCGLFPAIRSARQSIFRSLAQTSITQVSTRNRLQWLMVGIQVALAVTLLASAGLLLRSFQAIGRVSPGFDPTHVLTFHVSGNYGETINMKGLTQRIDRTLEELGSVPGVEATATAADLPGMGGKYPTEIKFVEGETDPSRKIMTDTRAVSPSYFATMRIPLLSGELCHEKIDSTQREILVNRSFANTYFHQSSPVGRHVVVPGSNFLPTGEIRGIVGDAREQGLDIQPSPTIYWCFSAPVPDPYYLVRTRTEPGALAQTIREKIHELEPTRSVFGVVPLSDHLDESFTENRLRMILLGFFAATAVSLACIGLYGTLSYSVSVRQREIGLRLALGAVRSQIVRQFLLQGLGVCLLGCLAGWALSAASGQLLSGMLYGVSPTDLVTLFAVVVIIVVVATFASMIPAVRASRVEPMQVLRNE